MRISRALALSGVDSRRKCEDYVTKGEVEVNGKMVTNLATQVDIEEDHISFRGRPVRFESYLYYLLFKPKGYTTTASDPHAKKTVYDLLPRKLGAKFVKGRGASHTRVFPVGRLDRDSTGLLLLTNDGDLANHLTHPRYGIRKIYEVRLNRAFEIRDKKQILEGVRLEDGVARVEHLHSISKRVLQVTMREGKKREVRRIFEALDYKVFELCRIQFGSLTLGNVRPGEGRFLSAAEVEELRRPSPPKTEKKAASPKRPADRKKSPRQKRFSSREEVGRGDDPSKPKSSENKSKPPIKK